MGETSGGQDPVDHIPPAHHRPEGEVAGGHALREGSDVGIKIPVLIGEKLAGPAETGGKPAALWADSLLTEIRDRPVL